MKNRLKIAVFSMAIIALQANEVEKPTPKVDSIDVAEYIKCYPAIKQIEMRDNWLKDHKMGEWQFTGDITAKDKTVVSPQVGTNYGYSWFNISKEPVVITMPKYDKYYSLSIFDMNHFIEVKVMPTKPVVIRLPHQKSPIEGAEEIVLQTYQGLAFSRQVIADNTKEVMKLAKEITIEGGGGDFPFVMPSFDKDVASAGVKKIAQWLRKHKDSSRFFVSPYEGGRYMDRAAGVMGGQLGIQSRYVQYGVIGHTNGKDSYEYTIPKDGLIRNDKGYWTFTIYNDKDRYLIPNKGNKYHVSSYNAKANADGTYTIRINPEGKGDNAIPTNGVEFYALFRVYEPVSDIKFPTLENISK